MPEKQNLNTLEDFIQKVPRPLKTRLLRLIEDRQIRTLEDFRKFNPNRLLTKNFGSKSLYDLNLLLTKEGYGFKKPIKKPNPTLKYNNYLKLRFSILQRDGFRCQYCGRNPKENKEVILHVDHIIPQSKGGLWEKGNLITSCSFCNLGKSDVILEKMKMEGECY